MACLMPAGHLQLLFLLRREGFVFAEAQVGRDPEDQADVAEHLILASCPEALPLLTHFGGASRDGVGQAAYRR